MCKMQVKLFFVTPIILVSLIQIHKLDTLNSNENIHTYIYISSNIGELNSVHLTLLDDFYSQCDKCIIATCFG